MSTRECGSSAGTEGWSHGNDAGAGVGVEVVPVDGGCGLADGSDGDLSAARQGVEYWHFRSTVVQFMQCGRVSSHYEVSESRRRDDAEIRRTLTTDTLSKIQAKRLHTKGAY